METKNCSVFTLRHKKKRIKSYSFVFLSNCVRILLNIFEHFYVVQISPDKLIIIQKWKSSDILHATHFYLCFELNCCALRWNIVLGKPWNHIWFDHTSSMKHFVVCLKSALLFDTHYNTKSFSHRNCCTYFYVKVNKKNNKYFGTI